MTSRHTTMLALMSPAKRPSRRAVSKRKRAPAQENGSLNAGGGARRAAGNAVPARPRQLRQPRLAELVAGALRERIVSGELSDGDSLPGLDKLIREFGVSPPSLREALRILENEGLITVRRGNVGGAVVHRPNAESAAYLFGLVLQAEQVPVADLGAAVGHLESLCARLCASRGDRRRTVVPELRRLLRAGEETLDDPEAYELACEGFHDAIVALCGNRTIGMEVGALEWLWRQQDEGWARRISEQHEYPAPKLRRAGLEAHAGIFKAIEQGDAEEAERLTRAHTQGQRIRAVRHPEVSVSATDVLRSQPLVESN